MPRNVPWALSVFYDSPPHIFLPLVLLSSKGSQIHSLQLWLVGQGLFSDYAADQRGGGQSWLFNQAYALS